MTIDRLAIVLVSTFRRGRCKRCHAAIVWFETVTGTWLPFDGHPQVQHVRPDESRSDRAPIGEVSRSALHWKSCPSNVDDGRSVPSRPWGRA